MARSIHTETLLSPCMCMCVHIYIYSIHICIQGQCLLSAGDFFDIQLEMACTTFVERILVLLLVTPLLSGDEDRNT